MVAGSLEAGRRAWIAPPTATPQRVAMFFRAIRRMPHILGAWFVRAESRRAIAMLSDHVLRDIGLTRHDVERELHKPFWRE